MNYRYRVWLGVLAASLAFGMGAIGVRGALRIGIDPLTFIGLKALVAAVIAITVLLVMGRPLRAPSNVLRIGFVLSAAHFTIPTVVFTLAFANAGAGFVGLLIGLSPLVTSVLAAFVLPEEPMTVVKAGGLFIALGGLSVLIISGDTGLTEGGRPTLASVLAMTGVLSTAVGNVYGRLHAGEYEPLHITGFELALGAIVLTPLMLFVDGMPNDISLSGWALIVSLAAGSTVFALIILYWVISNASATTTSLVFYLVPLTAVIGGIVLLEEELQGGIVIGGVLILSGVVLTQRATERASV